MTVLAYLAGLATAPVIVTILWAINAARSTGWTVECRCGYVTGDLGTTPRLVTWSRWRWHRAAHGLRITRRKTTEESDR